MTAIVITYRNGRWRAVDRRGRQVVETTGGANDVPHIRDFLDCMRTRRPPRADLATVGHPSSLLCHLGNAAWRAGRTLRFDAEQYRFVGDAEADRLLTRAEYRKPYELPALSQL